MLTKNEEKILIDKYGKAKMRELAIKMNYVGTILNKKGKEKAK